MQISFLAAASFVLCIKSQNMTKHIVANYKQITEDLKLTDKNQSIPESGILQRIPTPLRTWNTPLMSLACSKYLQKSRT